MVELLPSLNSLPVAKNIAVGMEGTIYSHYFYYYYYYCYYYGAQIYYE